MTRPDSQRWMHAMSPLRARAMGSFRLSGVLLACILFGIVGTMLGTCAAAVAHAAGGGG